MEAIVAPEASEILPDAREVAAALGMGWTAAGAASEAGSEPDERARAQRIEILIARALEMAADLLAPAGLWREVTRAEFAAVYAGAGKNAPRTPLAAIYPRAEGIALFAATLGAAVSERMARLFAEREFALAATLDAATSLAAEGAAEAVLARYRDRLEARGALRPGTRLLRYSPGYCGWHLSGQPALFAVLRPERIGLALRESHLMEPLKSVSGVIVGGPEEIHRFNDDFPFCSECRSRSCRARMAGAKE